MTILLVTNWCSWFERGLPLSSLLWFCFASFFSLALIPRDFRFIFFSSFLRLMSRIEGIMRRGWMTTLLCLFRIVWRQGAGHNWRTQDGDGSQGSKVPGGLAGRTWLCFVLVQQTAAATWRVLCALVCPVCSPCYFPLILCPTLFTSSGVFLLFLIFFLSSSFSGVCHIAWGGDTTVCFLCFFPIFFFFLLFRFVFFVLVFSRQFVSSIFSQLLFFFFSSLSIRLLCSCFFLFPFVSLFHRMRMSCLTYLPGTTVS